MSNLFFNIIFPFVVSSQSKFIHLAAARDDKSPQRRVVSDKTNASPPSGNSQFPQGRDALEKVIEVVWMSKSKSKQYL